MKLRIGDGPACREQTWAGVGGNCYGPAMIFNLPLKDAIAFFQEGLEECLRLSSCRDQVSEPLTISLLREGDDEVMADVEAEDQELPITVTMTGG